MMALPACVSLVWFITGTIRGGVVPEYPWSIEPFYPGLLISVGWFLTGRVMAKS